VLLLKVDCVVTELVVACEFVEDKVVLKVVPKDNELLELLSMLAA
jgi:hypothetical protein